MPADRSADRHPRGSRVALTVGEQLWADLGAKVGKRKRPDTVRRLIQAFVDGRIVLDEPEAPKPAPPAVFMPPAEPEQPKAATEVRPATRSWAGRPFISYDRDKAR